MSMYDNLRRDIRISKGYTDSNNWVPDWASGEGTMFTIEMEDDESCITVLDDTGELEDVSILLYDDYCHIRQWDEKRQMFEVITLTATMYLELMKAWNLPQGTYQIVKKDGQ
jgi:hypothetical protein